MTIGRTFLFLASFAAAAACGTHQSNREWSRRHCGDDIRVCEDGTPVGRKGPHCEYDPCPGPNSGAAFDLDDVPSDGQVEPVLNEPGEGSPPTTPE